MLSPPPRQRSVLQSPRPWPARLLSPLTDETRGADPDLPRRHRSGPVRPRSEERRHRGGWTRGRGTPPFPSLSQRRRRPLTAGNTPPLLLPLPPAYGWAGLGWACPRSRGRPTPGRTHLERPRLTRRPQPPWGGGGPGPPRRCPSGSRPARAGRRWRHMRSRLRPSSAAAAGGEPQRHRRAARAAGAGRGAPGPPGSAGEPSLLPARKGRRWGGAGPCGVLGPDPGVLTSRRWEGPRPGLRRLRGPCRRLPPRAGGLAAAWGAQPWPQGLPRERGAGAAGGIFSEAEGRRRE